MTTTARDLRDAGQDAAIAAADTAPHRGMGDFIRAAIDWHAAHVDSPWTCDDVRSLARHRAELAGVDFTPSVNLLPSLMGVAVGKGEIVHAAPPRNSTRRSRHASKVGRYLGPKFVREEVAS